MFDFDIIQNEAVLPPALGDRLYYRAIFPPGFCVLIVAVRPADAHVLWMVRLVIATSLFAAAPLFAYLASVWYGPENPPDDFGATLQSARIFNGGDPLLANSYTMLAISSWIASLYLYWPLVHRACGELFPPPRLLLLQLWRTVRAMLVAIAGIFIVQDSLMVARNGRYTDSAAFKANLALSITSILTALVTTAAMRRNFVGLIGRCAAKGETRSLAALSTIIGSHKPAVAVAAAAKAFRGLPFDRMSESDWATNEDTGLNANVVALAPGECDAFVTHSWRDDGHRKWQRLLEWRDAWQQSAGSSTREPTVWLDKACIDQTNIRASLTGLPMFVAWSNALVILASGSYMSRLWCIIELFTWVQMGCATEGILVYDIDPDTSLDDDLFGFRVANAACYRAVDKHRLLAVIENAFGDHDAFEHLVQDILQKQRGRSAITRRRSASNFMESFKGSTRDSRRRESEPGVSSTPGVVDIKVAGQEGGGSALAAAGDGIDPMCV